MLYKNRKEAARQKRLDRAFDLLSKMKQAPKGLNTVYSSASKYVWAQYRCLYVTDSYLIGRVEFYGQDVLDCDDMTAVFYFPESHTFALDVDNTLKDVTARAMREFFDMKPNANVNSFNIEELKRVLRFFDIFSIHPTIYTQSEYIDISGHNDEVSALFRLVGRR